VDTKGATTLGMMTVGRKAICSCVVQNNLQ
jgi:hypothetical protein